VLRQAFSLTWIVMRRGVVAGNCEEHGGQRSGAESRSESGREEAK
jgi:hypothetical protein